MAKNKKAQILAAVMCATTIVGFSPVITHAAENNIGSNNGTSNVTAHDNGYVTVGGTRFEFNSTGGASVIINNSGTLAIKGTGDNAFQADTNGNVTATGYISANRLHTIAAGIGTVDTLTGNRLLSVKDSANTENFFVKTDGLIGSKDSNGNLVFQMKDGAITAKSLKVTNDITLADGTSLQGMANTIKAIKFCLDHKRGKSLTVNIPSIFELLVILLIVSFIDILTPSAGLNIIVIISI